MSIPGAFAVQASIAFVLAWITAFPVADPKMRRTLLRVVMALLVVGTASALAAIWTAALL